MLPRLSSLAVVMMSLAMICLAGCRSANLSYVSIDPNHYMRHGLVWERISHDSSAKSSVNYFRWLHSPVSHMAGPSQYQDSHLSTTTSFPKTPRHAISPEVVPQQDVMGHSSPGAMSSPQNYDDESSTSEEPPAPPVELMLPPELAPPPYEQPKEVEIPDARGSGMDREPAEELYFPQSGPTAAMPQRTSVAPVSYSSSGSLPRAKLIFARP